MPFFEFTTKKHVSVVKIAITEDFFDKPANKFETPECQFDDLDGLSFSVVCEPYAYYVSGTYDLKVNIKSKPAFDFSCAVENAPVVVSGSYVYIGQSAIKPLCKDGKCTLTVTVKHQSGISVKTVAASCIQLQTHEIIGNAKDSTDAKIVVGRKTIKIHRGFLSTISPVFKAMFAHNTKESNDGIVNIRDMDAAVVKESIDLLYGRSVELKTIPQAIGILQFFEKYLIKGAIDRVESWVADYLNLEDFCAVIKHAWDHSSEKLQKRCRAFFRDNLPFALSEEYGQLPLAVIKSLSKRDVFPDLPSL
uniref:BTB domain-containing protein n=1 Tax=Panagrellus redivivus TaxID=6233 RepID=A0A7E4VR92_PANRE